MLELKGRYDNCGFVDQDSLALEQPFHTLTDLCESIGADPYIKCFTTSVRKIRSAGGGVMPHCTAAACPLYPAARAVAPCW